MKSESGINTEKGYVTNLRSENNLPTFQMNALVIIRTKVKENYSDVKLPANTPDVFTHPSHIGYLSPPAVPSPPPVPCLGCLMEDWKSLVAGPL